MQGGGDDAREGDLALAALLRLHNEAMSSGLLHAVTDGLAGDAVQAALHGYRYFGLSEAAAVAEAVRTEASDAGDDDLDDLEQEADRRYSSAVPDDETLVQAFVKKYSADADAFAPQQ